ncbi:MAG: tRNA (N(6)-L-threonylcarbamoyladenosine(37)-C(2))-methylthiotransferase MtaB, partial [Bacillota bacterium]|nr:tRNA (N(6)-L-threonylcarbamoyladenosine(37)-C(2))-methylthiotransferase MtaB [Bacillota bacterium]
MNQDNKRVAMLTLGCKTNIVESDAIIGALADAGCTIVDFDDPADYYIVNTCTVTHVSDRKSRQMLRRAKKHAPDAKLICMGCFSQLHKEEALATGADLVLGNGNKNLVIDYILNDELVINENVTENVAEDSGALHTAPFPILTITPPSSDDSRLIVLDDLTEFEEIPEYTVAPHTRSFIKIQDGCDRYCTYCIIPYARGKIRSRDLGHIKDEVERLVRSGYSEFVLTGIHLASYGKEKKDRQITLLDVVEAVNQIEGVRRIRLGSLEPYFIDDEFVRRIGACSKVCDHFHLSLQSGSDKVLRLMNRRYTAEDFYRACCRLREMYDNPSITTDIIVGFPGEEEDDFVDTMRLVEKVRFSDIHIFPYSERKGTPAVKFKGKVDERIKKRRAAELEALRKRLSEEYLKQYANKTLEVLIEEIADGEARGYSSNYIYVSFPADDRQVG